MAKKILVVDDNEGILAAFEVMLEAEGYDVATSYTAEPLLSLESSKFQPDLIVLDVLLSGTDGRDICKKLKSSNKTKKIPVMMVSAHPSADKSIKDAGADDFLSKPFEMDTLLNKVERLLKKA